MNENLTVQANKPFDLVCELSDKVWSSGVKISRVTNGTDESMLCYVDIFGSGSCNNTGLGINIHVSNNDTMTITVNFEDILCTDSGQYFCATPESVGAKTSLRLLVIRK